MVVNTASLSKSAMVCIFIILNLTSSAQLKYVVEDFEGISDFVSDLKSFGIFAYGNTKVVIENKQSTYETYSGERSIKITKTCEKTFGGWGKSINQNIELNVETDYLNFYLLTPDESKIKKLKIELQEDDNYNNKFEKESDDSWVYNYHHENTSKWKLISIPLKDFKDGNKGGNSLFDLGYKDGKLFNLIFSFENTSETKSTSPSSDLLYFDFISFSKHKLLIHQSIFEPLVETKSSFCSIGAWSKEGNEGNFTEIASGFEKMYHENLNKKIAVVHFFQPFGFEEDIKQQMNHYPSVDKINAIIASGYLPMITLEDHFVKTLPTAKQPNLYSIIEGHFDSFFSLWARQIKKVNGIILLRILHEFNGDWYPWCTINNDKNPQLVIKAYRKIHDIFKKEKVENVKFIWCPNSLSIPQENWNFIMNAYPGDEYVDFLGIDIYNGAGKGRPIWRSFRKEGIENYFIFKEKIPNKKIFVCETACRERLDQESFNAQTKSDWLEQASRALRTDMNEVRLLVWFNEKKHFVINSSKEAQKSYIKNFVMYTHFKSGKDELLQLMK